MSLLGTKVQDSITGIKGTVVAVATYLHDAEQALIAHGEKFESEWLAVARLKPAEEEKGSAKLAAAAKPAPTNGAADPAPAKPAADPAPAKSATTAAPATVAAIAAAPAATQTYAQVAAAFITLGRAGKGDTIKAILATHNVSHAKEIADNAPALADVLVQAQAAIATLPGATS